MKNKNQTYTIDLDGKCNQKCLFCMKSHSIGQARYLEYKEVLEKIRTAFLNKYKNIDFYGGEPTEYGFLADAMQFAQKLGLACFLATNATNFASEEFSEHFFSKVIPAEIRTTIHSFKPAVNDRITQSKGSFGKITKGIRAILQHKNVSLWVNIVINSLNYKDLYKTVEFLHELKVKNVNFSGLIMDGRLRHHKKLLVDLMVLQPYLRKAFQLAEDLGMDARIMKLPACLLLAEKLRKHQIIQEHESINFMKLPTCLVCKYNSNCDGIEKYIFLNLPLPEFCFAHLRKKHNITKLNGH